MDKIDAEYYKVNFLRLRKLLQEVHDLELQQRQITRQLDKVDRVAKSLKSFLRHDLSAVADPELNAEFEKIREFERLLAHNLVEFFESAEHETNAKLEGENSPDKFNKTHYFVKVMYQNNLKGSPSDLFSAIQLTPKKDLYNKSLIHSMLRKLKSRGLVDKEGEQYYLTEDGLKFAKEIE